MPYIQEYEIDENVNLDIDNYVILQKGIEEDIKKMNVLQKKISDRLKEIFNLKEEKRYHCVYHHLNFAVIMTLDSTYIGEKKERFRFLKDSRGVFK